MRQWILRALRRGCLCRNIRKECLEKLLDYLEENELQALFILSPTVMEEEKQKMYNYMGDIISGRGYEFLNMNDYYGEIGLDFAVDFSDYGGHVNALGAEKCTAFLSGYLVENLWDKRQAGGKKDAKAGMLLMHNG